MSKQAIAHKALLTLQALGYAYEVLSPEGEIVSHGQVRKAPARFKSKRIAEYADYTPHLLSQGMESLNPGECCVIDPGMRNITVLGKRVSAWAVKHWGRGNSTISTTDGKVTIVRVG